MLVREIIEKIKKAWEFLPLPIPTLRPSHCPPVKDKQRSQPTPNGIYMLNAIPYIIYIQGTRKRKIRANADVSLHYLCDRVKFAKFESTDDNVQ